MPLASPLADRIPSDLAEVMSSQPEQVQHELTRSSAGNSTKGQREVIYP